MARVTVEDCLEKIENRFALVLITAERVKQLNKGSKRLLNCKNENPVTALREIAAGKVGPNEKREEIIEKNERGDE